jgi:hypothetical protein
VGEILGAGPTLRDVERAWMKSPEHRALALDKKWTHAGWGSAVSGRQQVWVVQFTEKLVEQLTIEQRPGGTAISGIFPPAVNGHALLYDGLDPRSPDAWDAESRRFTFMVPAEGYMRLGFVPASGVFTLTNVFTLPRETGSPGEPDRFSPPAGSP